MNNNGIQLVYEGPEYIIHQLPRVNEGEVAYAVDTDRYLIYHNSSWEHFNIEQKNNIELSVYDMNKQIISQLKPLKENEIESKICLINEYKAKNFDTNYFMLYGKELNYFTLFDGKFENYDLKLETLGEAVISCLSNLGEIKSIEPTDDNAIEIWITDALNNTSCLYLFPYDTGVIQVRR